MSHAFFDGSTEKRHFNLDYSVEMYFQFVIITKSTHVDINHPQLCTTVC